MELGEGEDLAFEASLKRGNHLAEVGRLQALLAQCGFGLAPDFFAAVLRAALAVFRPGFRVARAVLRAVLRVARAVLRAALRGLVFLPVVRFFPLVLVAMACAPLLL